MRAIGEVSDYGEKFKKGSFLFEKHMPIYFSHLKSDNILVINKTPENEITTELKDSYCAEFNIVSMMDVPLRIEGKMIGVLCFE